MEQWKYIDNYWVSDIGNVKEETRKHGRYLQIKGGNTPMVHVLVAKAFCNWFEGCDVHHINFNPLDNRADNLVCLTKSEHQLAHKEQKVELGKIIFKGKHHTDEARKRMSDGHKGLKQTNEIINKRIDPLKIKVVEMDMDGNEIKVWDSISEAQQFYNDYHITEVCKGRRKSCAKRKWKYYDNVQ